MIHTMAENPYNVILYEGKIIKKSIELNRFELNENYYPLIRQIIDYLKDNRYEVDGSTYMENPKHLRQRQSFEISFRSRRKTGLFRNKTKYGATHTLWIGYTEGETILREVIFKIDGKPCFPNPALKEIYTIVRNRK